MLEMFPGVASLPRSYYLLESVFLKVQYLKWHILSITVIAEFDVASKARMFKLSREGGKTVRK